MQTKKTTVTGPRVLLTLATLSAAALLPLRVLAAQQDSGQPGAPGQQAPPPGQPGQPGQPGGRRGRGGQGNFAGRLPFANGQVTGIDAGMGTVTINSQFGGPQTILVPNTAKIAAMVQIDISKLKVGDTVQVQGVPTQMTASSITAGDMPDFLSMGFRGRGGAPGAPGGNGNNAQAGPQGNVQQPQRQQAFAMASGKVTSLEPLTVALSDEISIVMRMGPNARIMKVMPGTINNIKVGDSIIASGQAGQDGTFTATGVGVNMNGIGGPMGGRFGGPGAGFGPPGGFGGQGGFGGRGFRGRRGGQGGAGGQGAAGGGVGA